MQVEVQQQSGNSPPCYTGYKCLITAGKLGGLYISARDAKSSQHREMHHSPEAGEAALEQLREIEMQGILEAIRKGFIGS